LGFITARVEGVDTNEQIISPNGLWSRLLKRQQECQYARECAGERSRSGI
jgi:hypothetical protein